MLTILYLIGVFGTLAIFILDTYVGIHFLKQHGYKTKKTNFVELIQPAIRALFYILCPVINLLYTVITLFNFDYHVNLLRESLEESIKNS